MKQKFVNEKLKGIDILNEERKVLEGISQLPAGLRAAVLVKADHMRQLEVLLDRQAVATFQQTINNAGWQLRAQIALDILFRKLGKVKINGRPNS